MSSGDIGIDLLAILLEIVLSAVFTSSRNSRKSKNKVSPQTHSNQHSESAWSYFEELRTNHTPPGTETMRLNHNRLFIHQTDESEFSENISQFLEEFRANQGTSSTRNFAQYSQSHFQSSFQPSAPSFEQSEFSDNNLSFSISNRVSPRPHYGANIIRSTPRASSSSPEQSEFSENVSRFLEEFKNRESSVTMNSTQTALVNEHQNNIQPSAPPPEQTEFSDGTLRFLEEFRTNLRSSDIRNILQNTSGFSPPSIEEIELLEINPSRSTTRNIRLRNTQPSTSHSDQSEYSQNILGFLEEFRTNRRPPHSSNSVHSSYGIEVQNDTLPSYHEIFDPNLPNYHEAVNASRQNEM